MKKTDEKVKKSKPAEFIENVDYYYENNLMVLTAHFLKQRGYCCHNGCRHCPYRKTEENNL